MITALLALLSPAMADGAAKLKVEPIVDAWVAYDQTSSFAVDAEGTQGGQGGHLDTRQRLGVNFVSNDVAIGIIVGGQTDQVWGDTWDIPGAVDERGRHQLRYRTPAIRKLAMTANLQTFQLELGLTTSTWGLGMLANDGIQEPFFGQPEFGDRVVRARMTTKPQAGSPWHFTAAWDRVLQDEVTVDVNTQWTNQAIVSVLWRKDDDQAGIYGAVRRQDELLYSRSTRVTVVDAFTDLHVPITEGLNLHLAAEGAGITGKTNRSTTYNARDRVHVLSAGAVGVAMLGMRDDTIQVGLSSGFATGDGDPNDDTMADFSFDRNFDVGMVLFDEVMGSIDAAHYNLVTDPSYAGRPPDGVEATVNEGSFRRATYVQPRVEVTPVSWARARLGALFAWSTAPVSHGFYTLRNGGVPVNHLKQPTSGYALGTELDWSLQIGPFLDDDHFLSDTRVSFQGGHAFLDSNLGGERVDRYIMMLHVL